MLQLKNPEVHSVQRRKILLVGAEPPLQGLISTFLMTMGWTCTAVQNMEQTPITLQREAFDAVVIDLGRSETEAEQAILRIKQIRPSLADRILVINIGADRRILELMERHDLIQLSQESLLPQLWAALQGLFDPPRARETALLRSVQVARLVFDSFRRPLPAGVRGFSTETRHLAYQHKKTVIDLAIELNEGSGQTSLAGQVLGSEGKGKNEGLSVLLVSGTGTLTRTATNRFGEFHMEGEFPDDVSVEIRLGERSWVTLPLGKMGSAGGLRSKGREEA